MPSTSRAQRRFFAMCQHGKATRARCPTGMSKKSMRHFSTTSEKGLPERKVKSSR